MSDVTQNLQIRGEDRTAAAFNSVMARVKKMDVAFGVAVGNIASEAARKLGSLVVAGFKAGDAIVDLSDRLGVSAGDMSVLAIAADKADTSLEFLAKKTVVLGGAVQDALSGKTSDAVKTMKLLGITTEELTKVQNDSVAQLKLVAGAFSAIPDGANKAAYAVNIFGKGGEELVPVMKEAGKVIHEAADEADRLGSRISDLEANKIRKADDKFKEFNRTVQYVSRTLALAAIDAFDMVNDKVGDIVMTLQLGIDTRNRGGQRKPLMDPDALKQQLAGIAGSVASMKFPQFEILSPQQVKAQKAMAEAAAKEIFDLRMKQNKEFEAAMQKHNDVMMEQEVAANAIIVTDRAKLNEEEAKKRSERMKQQLEDEQQLQDWIYDITAERIAREHELEVDFLEQSGILTRDQILGIANYSQLSMTDQAKTVTGIAANMFGALAGHSKKAHKLYQAFAIAEAVISTAKAAIAGFAYGMAHGGPYAAAALAASAVIAGALQIAKIRSSQPGGGSVGAGGGGGGVGGGGVGGGADVQQFVPPVKQGIQNATIVLQGHTFSREAVIDLLESVNEVLGDGATLNVQQNG